ncbi:polysaccharide deacetylase family protein [Coraliomargarita sp. W4R53]
MVAHVNDAGIPTFQESLIITGAPVIVEIAPLFNDKDWALTTRWDDSNPNSINMHDAMAEIGLKGSFFVNGSKEDTGAMFVQQLSQDGTSVAGHTTHHYFLPMLTANALFEEILFNRIEREAETNTPINSFAFPYNSFKDNNDSDAFERISKAWLRSGYHHVVSSNFIKNNPYIHPHAASTVLEVMPGDKIINAEAFRSAMDDLFAHAEEVQKTSRAISVGIHPWQSPEELIHFKQLLSEYMSRQDFWYCNQTELAGYFIQVNNTVVNPIDGQSGCYMVTRPRANHAGSEIPLTLLLTGPQPEKVELNGQILAIEAHGDHTWLVNLPYPSNESIPELIDWSSNGSGFKGHEHVQSKFPGLSFKLNETSNYGWQLTLANQGATPLHDLTITLRLPLIHQNGLRLRRVDKLVAGQVLTLDFDAGIIDDTSLRREGRLFAAAEVDFTHQGTVKRLYSVYLGEADSSILRGPRDAVALVGPFTPGSIDPGSLLPYSLPHAELIPVNNTPLGQWHYPSREQSLIFNSNRIIETSTDSQWQEAAKSFYKKHGIFALLGDFEQDAIGKLMLKSSHQILYAAVDGQPVDLNNPPILNKGQHRLLTVLNGRMYFINPAPWIFKVTIGEQAVAWLPAKNSTHE